MEEIERRSRLIEGSSGGGTRFLTLTSRAPGAAPRPFPMTMPSAAINVPSSSKNAMQTKMHQSTSTRRGGGVGFGKFEDFGKTNYTATSNKSRRCIAESDDSPSPVKRTLRRRDENARRSDDRKPSCSSAKGKGKGAVSLCDDDASSDELNLTDASAPIESPTKHIGSNYRTPWLMTMSSDIARRPGQLPPSQSKAKQHVRSTIFSEDSEDSPKKTRYKTKLAEKAGRKGTNKEGMLLAALNDSKKALNSHSSSQEKSSVKGKRKATVSSGIVRAKNNVVPKPRPHPLCAPSKLEDGKRAVTEDTDEDGAFEIKYGVPSDSEEIPDAREPRPFPMSSLDFLGDLRKPPSKSSTISTSSKRSSGDDSDGASTKKRKPSRYSIDESFEFPATQVQEKLDPNTICPFCDMSLPSEPSPMLSKMLKRLQNTSHPDPRPMNPLGRKAPLISYVDMCQRHQFETTLLPEAHRKGWPTQIDFTSLPDRVQALRDVLSRYIASKDSSSFWQEIKQEIEAKGARKVLGVVDSFNTFDKSLPGYYGEQGSIIIAQTLYDLFPLESIDADLVAPLTPSEFIQRILVPESAVALVQEDMRYSFKDEALATLRESSKFGTAMFPDLDGRMGVGDKIVRSRARARLKQETEERRLDEELERLTSEDDKMAQDTDNTERSGASDASSRPKQARPKMKSSSNTVRQRDTELIELSDSSTHSSTLVDSQGRDQTRSRKKALVHESDATPKVKPRPKFKKATSVAPRTDDEATPRAPRTRGCIHSGQADGLYKSTAGSSRNHLKPVHPTGRKNRENAKEYVYSTREEPVPSALNSKEPSNWLWSQDSED